MVPVVQLFVEQFSTTSNFEEIFSNNSRKDMVEFFDQIIKAGIQLPRPNIANTLTNLYDAMEEYRKTEHNNLPLSKRPHSMSIHNSETAISGNLHKYTELL